MPSLENDSTLYPEDFPVRITIVSSIALVLSIFCCTSSFAQSYGIELHNNLMPASGGMAGTSLARPQDLQSAINGNPATLTQYRGTQFAFGGAWVEPTINLNQATPLPLIGVTPFASKSTAAGSALGAIGVTQDLNFMGLPATFGMGFLPNAGISVDHRHVPNSNGTHASYVALDIVPSIGLLVTENLSVGASMALGTSFMDGPFVARSGMGTDYALRGKIGATYDVGNDTTLGAYWETEKDHRFDNFVSFAGGNYLDLALEHPENIGIGVANQSLMNGRLLLAADLIFKNWSQAEFFSAIYKDQWIATLGAQFEVNCKTTVRAGYAYADNPLRPFVPVTIGGITPPGGVPAINYVQAQFGAINTHRITAGVAVRDVLPGVDLDLFGGGMPEASQTFGTSTVSLASYWVGAGLTWRFNRGACPPEGCGDSSCSSDSCCH